MSDVFNATYHVADGYIAGKRPQNFTIRAGDLEDDMGEEALRQLYCQAMQDDFEQRIFPEGADEDKFVAWALQQLAERTE